VAANAYGCPDSSSVRSALLRVRHGYPNDLTPLPFQLRQKPASKAIRGRRIPLH